MATTITISVYSGRSNPRFVLSKAQERELGAMIAGLRRKSRTRVTTVRGTGFGVIRITRKVDGGRATILCGGGLVDFPGLPFSFQDSPGIGQFLLGICPDPLLIRPIKQALIDIWLLKEQLKIGKKPPCNPNF